MILPPYRLPRRAPGERADMQISGGFLECAVFLSSRNRNGKIEPHGTGFVVSVPDETDPQTRPEYVVTSRHCVDEVPGQVFVRFNTFFTALLDAGIAMEEGSQPLPGYCDVPTNKNDWLTHDTADVAAILLPKMVEHPIHSGSLEIETFVSRDYRFRPPAGTLYGKNVHAFAAQRSG